ncbi:unnamed protein product [Closterium sp. NIES-53]
MDSRREWPPSRRMRSLERGRLPTRLPCRAAYSADRVTPVGVRRDGGGPDPHIRLEPRSQALNSDPWDLARGQRGMEERCCDDDMLDSSDSAKEANGEDEADDIPIAWDDEREGVVEDERDEGSKNAGASGSLGGMRRGSVRRGESADAGHAVDEMGLRQRKVPQKRRCRSRGGQNGWRQGKAPRKRCGRSLAKGDARRREGYRGRQEGQREPGVEVRDKQDMNGQRKRGEKRHMQRERTPEYDTKNGEEEEDGYDRDRGRHGKEEQYKTKLSPAGREGYEGWQEGRREPDRKEREKQDKIGQRGRKEEQRRWRELTPEHDTESEEEEEYDRPALYGFGRREKRWGEYSP